MVASNIKQLSRLELLYTCVANLVKYLYKKGEDIPSGMKDYCEADDLSKVIYHTRSIDISEKIEKILYDASFLMKKCAGSHDESSEYQLLVRVINEQTVKVEDGTLILKEKTVSRAKQLRYMKSSDFIELAKIRNGVESLPSILRRKYRVDEMPVRGRLKTKLFFGSKIVALNFKKLLDYLGSLDKCAIKPEVC